MKKILLPTLLLLAARLLPAQTPFSEKQYTWTLEKNLVYGVAINYLGLPDTLTLDLYTPQNTDTVRPLVVLVHGGSWLGGCKEDIAWLCEELAARGYVAATVKYRKGWHKDDYVPNPINPDVFPGGNCLYTADSMEIYRAIYRGQQDVKGAIRWLKARLYTGPGCDRAVLVGGESAGAFISLAVGLLDRPEEKPVACGALPDVLPPGNNLSNCYTEQCAMVSHSLPPGALQRPDLGPVDGTLNTNGFDANVLGVMSFYGGVPYEALSHNWVQGPDTPALYLYHQTCDGVVPFGFGQPMFIASAYCNLGYTPWHYLLPNMYGNGSIAAFLGALTQPPPYLLDFLPCDNFNPGLALFECLRYNDNGSYHYTHNRPERAAKIAGFFGPMLAARLNAAPCVVSAGQPAWAAGLRPAPNPAQEHVWLYCDAASEHPVQLSLFDTQGRLMAQQWQTLVAGANPLPWSSQWPAGLYSLQLTAGKGTAVWKVLKQ